MPKILTYIGAGIFVVLALIFVADYFLNVPILRSLPLAGKVTCQFPTTVSGNSMEPAIGAGSRVTFNKCFENKENLSTGTVILYRNERGNSIARIKEKIPQQDQLIYKVSQDNRPE